MHFIYSYGVFFPHGFILFLLLLIHHINLNKWDWWGYYCYMIKVFFRILWMPYIIHNVFVLFYLIQWCEKCASVYAGYAVVGWAYGWLGRNGKQSPMLIFLSLEALPDYLQRLQEKQSLLFLTWMVRVKNRDSHTAPECSTYFSTSRWMPSLK